MTTGQSSLGKCCKQSCQRDLKQSPYLNGKRDSSNKRKGGLSRQREELPCSKYLFILCSPIFS